MKDEIKEILEDIKEIYYFKPLLDYITNLQEENERLKREKIQKELCESLLDECDAHNKCLQLRIDKAIEYIEYLKETTTNEWKLTWKDLLNILQGKSDE